MKMKKLLSILMSLVMLAGITAGLDLSAYAAAPANYVVNTLGTETTGYIGIGETKYIRFTLPSSGRVNFMLRADFKDEYDYSWSADYAILDESGTQMKKSTIFVNDNTEIVYNDRIFIDLLAGTYYFSLCPSYEDSEGEYSLKTQFTPSGETFAETPAVNNDTMATADVIELNKTYNGQLAWNESADYYKFTVDGGHYLFSLKSQIQYFYQDVESTSCWADICGIGGAEIDLFGTDLKTTGYYETEYKKYLPQGTYYLKVYTFEECTGNYSFSVTPVPHTFDQFVVAPTCTEQGYTKYWCMECDYEYIGNYVNAAGHNFGADGNAQFCLACGIGNPNYIDYTLPVIPAPVEPAPVVPAPVVSEASNPKKTSVSKLTKGKKQFKVAWKKVSDVSGYQVQYATDKKFKKNKKTVTVKGAKATSKTVKSLKSKKTYYVRVRTYKTVNGKKVYSAWSKAKSVKTK